ncbi:uncharacterized protein LOC143415747 [Maylandia zebra]|uniref:uncharacterized protein LOC143415747 n=1 Tax=Maylandia zebra TaxID=106582 RepID=UPI00403CEEE2
MRILFICLLLIASESSTLEETRYGQFRRQHINAKMTAMDCDTVIRRKQIYNVDNSCKDTNTFILDNPINFDHFQILRAIGKGSFGKDNDPKDTARLCRSYLTKKDSDGVLWQMARPPQSPDLNHIEMVWDEMDRRVKAIESTSAQHLWKLHQDSWKTISAGGTHHVVWKKTSAEQQHMTYYTQVNKN